jgi:hypothetical protein
LKNSSIYPFNLQSNVVTSISLSLLVQIWYFFLNFSKIIIYSLISLFSVHSVCWVMFICLILFFVSTTNNICFTQPLVMELYIS